MKILSYRLFALIWIVIALLTSMAVPAMGEVHTRHIVVINSYHTGFIWTDMQTDRILEELKDAFPKLIVSVEYLDWKQNPTQENLDMQKDMMLQKYAHRNIDIVMTTDDAALKFVIENREDLFGDIPIVFSGILQESADAIIGNEPNITGVYEVIDVETTVRHIMMLQPNIQNLYVINDTTESGAAAGNSVISYMQKAYPDIQMVDLAGKSAVDIQQTLYQANAQDAAILTVYLNEPNGVSHDPEFFSTRFSETSAIPIFSTYEFVFGYGITGGSLLSGSMQGFEAAQLAIAILRGITPDILPIVDQKTVYYGYDYHYLQRYNLDANQLPPHTTIINKPFSFFETYQVLVLFSLALFLFLLSLVLILFLNIREKKKAQKTLLKQNRELNLLYESLSSSEEELRVTNDDLFTRQQTIEASEARFRLLAESANDLFWDWDITQDVLHLEPKTLLWFQGIADHVLTMQDWLHIIVPEDAKTFEEETTAYLSGQKDRFCCEFRIVRPDHQVSWLLTNAKAARDADGKLVKMVGTLTDITETKKNRTQIEHLAYHDTLTRLPNRIMIQQVVDRMIGKCKGVDLLVLFFIDLDNFRFVNNNYGHQIGDEVLTSLSGRLQSLETLENKGMFGRFGGDEFVYAGCFPHLAAVYDFSVALRNVFQQPFAAEDALIYMTSSIGYAVAPEDGQTFEELLTHADMAMFMTKQEGKNRIRRYESYMEKAHGEREVLIQELRHGISNNEFLLFYQPQVDVELGFIHGFEALIRWNNPRLGRVSPDQFIPLAESSGLIIPLGEWIIREACKFAVKVNTIAKRALTISVNLSMVQLMQPDFSNGVSRIFQETGVEPSLIEFEITESVLAESFDSIVEQLNNLRTLGSAISLDDFGTGYSSLTYLKALPILTLKIDKSFIDDIATNYKNHIFIETIITLGQKMGLRLVAEGVEDYQQLNYLKSCGCHLYQGYLFSKPVPEEDALIQAISVQAS